MDTDGLAVAFQLALGPEQAGLPVAQRGVEVSLGVPVDDGVQRPAGATFQTARVEAPPSG